MRYKRPKISSVFTPRNAEVNKEMYISRPGHEKELTRALEGSLHPFIFGHSGSGKSWLYKKVLDDIGAYYVVANCAKASMIGSLTEEIKDCVLPTDTKEFIQLCEEVNAEGNIVAFKGGMKTIKTYDLRKEDALTVSFHYMRKKSKKRISVLVIDNIESIFANAKIMEEISNLIVLSDDPRYAKYNVKVLLVGVPSGVLEYFSKTKNLPTVANRIQELSEVSGLTRAQVFALVKKGFQEILKVSIDNKSFREIQSHTFKVTLGIPQRVHEYCLNLGYLVQDNNWAFKKIHLSNADIELIKQGLREAYFTVESLMNQKETKVGRRNQVLFVLGMQEGHSFTSDKIEEEVRNEFPRTTSGIKLGIHQTLVDLAQREPTIIKRSRRISNTFEFLDPRHLMVLRLMLQKDKESEKVIKLPFKQ